MRFDVETLLGNGLLARIPESVEKAEQSLSASRNWILEAENNLKSNAFRSCILSSYLAMFHSARSILFLKGFREKSHFAVARFLENSSFTKEILEIKWVRLLDFYRETRHEDQYSTFFAITKTEAENALKSAKEFSARMKSLKERIQH